MKDIIPDLKDKITSELAGNPNLRKDVLSNFPVSEETHLNYLKNKKNITEIEKLFSNKKLSNKEVKLKIKEFLKKPNNLVDFLEYYLKNKKTKKETKEASTAGTSSGTFITKMGDSKEISNMNTKKVPTVREEETDDIKKTETKEATSSSSSGQYSTPKIWAKSLNKKDFRGYAKPVYKGGKFVQVKKKCKKFPYCNQGDITALKIFENQYVQDAIENISNKYKIEKNYLSDLIFEKIKKTIS